MLKEEQVSDKLIDKLLRVGLSDCEIKVYLYLLKRGSSLAREVIKDTNTVRITTYTVLSSLMKKGFVIKTESGKKKTKYVAEPPSKILNLLRTQLIQTRRVFNEFKESMVDLEVLYNENKSNKPKIIFCDYGEMNILKTCQQNVMGAKSKVIYEIANFDNNPLKKEELDYFDKEHQKRGMRFETLYTSSKGDILKKLNRDGWKTFYIPNNRFKLISADVVVYDDKVILTSYEGNIKSIFIEDHLIAETLKELIKLLKISIECLSINSD